MLTVTKLPTDDPTHLYCRYPAESTPQPCHVAIDLENRTLTCDYNPSVGASTVPKSVYHGIVIWIPIPILPSETANRLLDEITRLVQQVVDGASIVWDGHNHVGQLNDTASEALDQVQDYIASAYSVDDSDADLLVQEYEAYTWTAEDPFTSAEHLNLTADTPDDELPAIAAALEQQIRSESGPLTVITGALAAVDDLRDTLREQQREKLTDTAEKIELLLQERDALIRQIHSWKVRSDSLRSIGALADLSHSRVDQIIKSDAASDTEPDWEYRIQERQADGTFDNDGGSDQLGEALDRCDHLNAGVPRHMNWRWYRVVDRDGTVRQRATD